MIIMQNVPDSGACPSGFSGGEDWSSCYKVVEESVSWHTARLNCLNLGGYLAEINSEEELQYLDQTYGGIIFLLNDLNQIGCIKNKSSVLSFY